MHAVVKCEVFIYNNDSIVMGVRTWGQMGSADPPLEKWMKN